VEPLLRCSPVASSGRPGLGAIYVMLRMGAQDLEETASPATVANIGCGGLPLFTEISRETVWEIKVAPILESHEWADREQQALSGHLMAPKTILEKPSNYFPDSLRRGVFSETRGRHEKSRGC
jgi:hypothetical protein